MLQLLAMFSTTPVRAREKDGVVAVLLDLGDGVAWEGLASGSWGI